MATARRPKPGPGVLLPQQGKQELFLSSDADIVIYGGSAFGGKTFGLLLEAARNRLVPNFTATIFRKTAPEIRNPGGMWDESLNLYASLGGLPREQDLNWKWPGGGRVKFASLQYEKDLKGFQGTQICLVGFDQLEHFSQREFFYMLSRNRSLCGVRPYCRATCNPDPDSWLAEFIAWWIDEQAGYPIEARAGVKRWFVRLRDSVHWGDSAQELIDAHGAESRPKSVTFIPADIWDNRIGMERDPDYLANLLAQNEVDKERLLHGNWKIRPTAGLFFQRSWLPVLDECPVGTKWIRKWDLAGTPKTSTNNPDWTVGAKLGKMPDGRYIMAHAIRDRVDPGGVITMIKNIASQDGKDTEIVIPRDPAQAGKFQAQWLIGELGGYTVTAQPESGDKLDRFKPFSSQCKVGNVVLLRGPWNEETLRALESVPDAGMDDADAWGGAFEAFHESTTGLIDYYRQEAERLKKARENPG